MDLEENRVRVDAGYGNLRTLAQTLTHLLTYWRSLNIMVSRSDQPHTLGFLGGDETRLLPEDMARVDQRHTQYDDQGFGPVVWCHFQPRNIGRRWGVPCAVCRGADLGQII